MDILESGYIPSNDEIPKDGKKVIIIEDIPYNSLDKESKQKLYELLKYSISHKCLDLIFTGHDFVTTLPTSMRRLFNIFIIYKTPDILSLGSIGSRIGLKNSDFFELFKLCKNQHDNLCIDLTKDTPAPLRLNIYKKIEIQ